MTVSLIFKIACSGGACFGHLPGAEAQWKGGACVFDQPGGSDPGAVLAGTLYL